MFALYILELISKCWHAEKKIKTKFNKVNVKLANINTAIVNMFTLF